MSMQDPIADMLTRIRNAQKASKNSVTIPGSKHKVQILNKLNEAGYVGDIEVTTDGSLSNINVQLKYHNCKPTIRTIKRISRPGLRIYKQSDNIDSVANGLGTSILSTSKGVLTDKEARQAGVGGEVICEVF